MATHLHSSALSSVRTIGRFPSVSIGDVDSEAEVVSLSSDDGDNGGVVALEKTNDGVLLPLDGALSCRLGELIVTARDAEEAAAEARAGKKTIETVLLAVSLWPRIEG